MVYKICIILLLFLSPPITFAQQRKIIQSERQIKIRYKLDELTAVKERILWYTTDGGKTWERAEGVKWVYEEGVGNYVIFDAPSEGEYGFFLQFSDLANNLTPPPRSGEKPQLTVVIKAKPREIEKAREHFKRGAVLAAQGRDEEAIFEYKKALKFWDELVEAYIDLGILYYKKKMFPRALEYFLKAKKISPNYVEAYTNAALVYLELGMLEESLSEFKDAVSIGLSSRLLCLEVSDQLLYLARLFMAKNLPSKAKEAARMILKIAEAPRVHKREAEKIIKSG
jgi:tetratricopeptide (TPR) repeat protein